MYPNSKGLKMIYKFIDNKGTFTVKNPQNYNLYLPLTNKDGSLLSSISPNLAGDIKADNDHFITPPASIIDIKNNLLCRRDFFIKKNKQVLRLSLASNDVLEAGFLYHKVIKKTKGLHIEILNFIPANLSAEIMWVKVINKNKKAVKLTPTSFIPLYGRSSDNLRDHRHVSSLLNRIRLHKYGIFLKPTMVFDEKGHKVNDTTYFCLGFEGKKTAPLGQFPTLDYFCGKSDLLNPQAIAENITPVTKETSKFNGKETVAAFRFTTKTLQPKQEVNYFLIMGMNTGKDSKQLIMKTFAKLNSPVKIEKSLKETKEYWLNYLSRINFDFKNKDFNNWLLWVKIQPTLRKLFGCSFLPHFDYGKGGRGWRDLWQDALTLLINEPNQAKKLILNNLSGVRIDGSNATIITKKGRLISDRNKISRIWMDHGVWPYLTLNQYINTTADLDILNTEIPYFRDHLLMRGKEVDSAFSQEDYTLRNKNGKVYTGTVLEHILLQHLTSFFNVGKHNIIRLENADWNDGLDMAAKEGESVTFSFMYAHNLASLCILLAELNKKTKKIKLLKEIASLLDRIDKPINYDNFREKQKVLEKYLKRSKDLSGERIELKITDLISDLQAKSMHLHTWLKQKEWLNEGFFNGYYDNKSKKAEGILKGKVKMLLPSQVFPIMSGVASSDQIRKTWNSIKKYLRDPQLGGIRLNTNFGLTYLDLGRAFGFSYGDKENGAFFNHMIIMLGFSLYKQGFIKEGFETINSIYKMATNTRSEIYPLIPEYFNSQGKGLYLYLTGSASWYIYTLLEEILGIKFKLGNMLLNPKLLHSNFTNKHINVNWSFKNKQIHLSYLRGKNKTNPLEIKKILLNNVAISKIDNSYSVKSKYFRKGKNKTVKIEIFFK